jgi:hypothetical protein
MKKLAKTLINIAIVTTSFIIIAYIWQCVNYQEIKTTPARGNKEMPLVDKI